MSRNFSSFLFIKQNLLTKLSVLIVCVSFVGKGWGQTTPYTSSTTWTVPAGVTCITVELWGAGGGSGGAKGNTYVDGFGNTVAYGAGAGGGGGGAFSKTQTITVTPGQVITITVGTGGSAGTTSATNGGNGGTSSVLVGSTTYQALGGSGGAGRNSTTSNGVGAGGNGGVAETNGTLYSIMRKGGNGAAGIVNGSFNFGGSGGGAGGSTSDGGNAAAAVSPSASVVGASGGSSSGTGGTGQKVAGVGAVAANNGNSIGGGAGGPGNSFISSAGTAGRTGANGEVRITICTPACSAPTSVSATSNSPICTGSQLNLTGAATGNTSWSWLGPNNFSSTDQSPSISSATTAASGTYFLTAQNSCGTGTGLFDDFSDNNFTSNPVWTEQTGTYNTGVGYLQPTNTFTDERITTPSTQAYGSWKFDFQLVANVNSNDVIRFHMISNNTTLNNSSGYYVRISGVGSASGGNGIHLYRIDNSTTQVSLGSVSYTPSTSMRTMIVTRGSDNVFRVYLDGSSTPILTTTADGTYTTSSFAGVWTSGNNASTNHIVDNIVCSSTLVDVTVNPIATAGTFQYANLSTQTICAGSTISCSNVTSPTNGGAGTLTTVWYCGELNAGGTIGGNYGSEYGNWRESTLLNVSGTTSSSNLNAAAGGGAGTSFALTNYNPQSDFPGKTNFVIIRRAYNSLCGVCVGGCQDQYFYLNLTPVTAAPTITSPICSGATTISGTSAANASVIVTVNGVVQSPVTANGSGNWSATVSPLIAAQSITATAQVSGQCVSASSNIVTVNPAVSTPTFTLGTASTRCIAAGTVSYTATSSGATGITYSLDAVSITGGVTINSSTGDVTYPATWSGTTVITASAAGCGGPLTSTHTVSILAAAQRIAPTGPQCSGTTLNFSATSVSGVVYAWTVTPPSGLSASPTTGSSNTFSTTLTNSTTADIVGGSAYISVTQTSNGVTCTTTFNPTIRANPVATVSSATLSVCGSLTSGSLGGNTPPTGTGVWTYVSGVTGSFSNTASPSSTFTASAYGTSVLRWTVSNAPCADANATVTVTFSPTINWANTQSPVSGSICSNNTFDVYGQVLIAGITDAAGATPGLVAELGYSTSNSNPSTWTNWQPASFNVQVGNNDEFKSTLSGLVAGTYFYAFRYSYNGCAYVYGGYSAPSAASNIWTINAGGGGAFIGSSTTNGGGSSGINSSNGSAFGLFNSSGGTAEAIRNFPSILVGQTVQFDMDNGYVNTGGPAIGVGLQNTSGQNVWEIFFSGGASGYSVNGSLLSPTVPYTANGLRITFTLLTATTYSATIQILNGGATYGPYTGTLLSPGGGQSITRFRAFNFNAGAGVNNNFFVNNIITPSFFDNASTYSAIANSTQSTTSVGGIWNSPTIGNGTLTVTTSPTTSSAGTTQTICEGNTVTLTSNVPSVGTGAWSISSGPNTNSNQLSSTSANNPVFTPTAAGTYTLVWTITNGSCTSTSNATITVTSGILNFVNVQTPSATICNGASQLIYGQVYEPGVTDTWYSQGAGITVEYGFSSSNTHPNTWTTWTTATYNTTSYGNNDEYSGNLYGLSSGTYYYSFRYKLNCGAWQYGGTGGTWSSNSGILSVNDCYGSFGSAVYMQTCSNNVNSNAFFRTEGTISSNNFTSNNFGSYFQNSGDLKIQGGEVKTWKAVGANVCEPKLYYSVYPTGVPSGVFNPITLPFYENCSGTAFASGDPCTNIRDQKWQRPGNGNPFSNIDLTTYSPGTYQIEVYYEIPGNHSGTTGCPNLVYVNNNGTNYIASFTIVAAPSASSTGPYCVGNTIQLNASSPSNYSWSGPNSFSNGTQNPTIAPATSAMAGIYTITSTLANGCSEIATTTVVINSPTIPTFNQVSAICTGGSLSALPTTSTNGITGTWSPALNNSATTTYTFTPSGSCVSNTTMTITVNAPPNINSISPP